MTARDTPDGRWTLSRTFCARESSNTRLTADANATAPMVPYTSADGASPTVKPGSGGTPTGCLVTAARRPRRSNTASASGTPSMSARWRDSICASSTVRAEIVSSMRLTDDASVANSSLPFHSSRGQSVDRWPRPSARTASVIFVSGFSRTRACTQNSGSTRRMPAMAMKKVSRPSAECVTLERDFGSRSEMVVTASPAMSRTEKEASSGFSSRFQNPPE